MTNSPSADTPPQFSLWSLLRVILVLSVILAIIRATGLPWDAMGLGILVIAAFVTLAAVVTHFLTIVR